MSLFLYCWHTIWSGVDAKYPLSKILAATRLLLSCSQHFPGFLISLPFHTLLTLQKTRKRDDIFTYEYSLNNLESTKKETRQSFSKTHLHSTFGAYIQDLFWLHQKYFFLFYERCPTYVVHVEYV